MYHEDVNELSEKAKDISRALNSLKEEIEAVDWYNQRADTTKDEAVKAIVEHNRDEEIEHAAMIIEWLRRNMPAWDEELKTYLFTEGSITELEENEEGEASGNDLGLSNK
ncbi:MAG: ferritin-like domain-containing protein [Kosmotogaceae bacterium]